VSTKNEVKINKISEEIRSELSLALNNWQDIDSKVKKNPESAQKEPLAKKPKQKTKLLKTIQAQLKTLSL
jgi:hypothetical protein